MADITPCRGGACSALFCSQRCVLSELGVILILSLVGWWRSWGAHQIDEHSIESLEIGINQDFDSL